jgi:hypothetical protein
LQVDGNGDSCAYSARESFDSQITGEIGQVSRDVSLQTGKQMVESEQYEPVFVLLPLILGTAG